MVSNDPVKWGSSIRIAAYHFSWAKKPSLGFWLFLCEPIPSFVVVKALRWPPYAASFVPSCGLGRNRTCSFVGVASLRDPKIQRITSVTPKLRGRTMASNTFTPVNGAIPKTPYAAEYVSRYGQVTEMDAQLLSHLNCSYFSTTGVAPTLLALKKHAQALAILIRQISVSTSFGEVDGKNHAAGGHAVRRFRENEAFDWLDDLSTPYHTDDEWHHKPLVELMNQVAAQTDVGGVAHHCPLTLSRQVEQYPGGQKVRPYANHAALTMHANECLEILDHEYSATGGLMSLLPTDAEADREDMEAARNTLLGQWLLFNQHLVGRMHELELSYAQALDALKGEAAIPLQTLSKTAGSGGAAGSGRGDNDNLHLGREIGYPQDRWILCNSGDDVFEHIHRVLDRQEALIEPKERIWKQRGVMGERMWRERRGGDVYDRGLVAWDAKTRFIRLRGKTRSPIFILPAHGELPGTAETVRLEEAPKVVSVVTPTWPARTSDWERKYVDKLDKATKTEIANMELAKKRDTLESKTRLLDGELQNLRFARQIYEEYYGAAATEDGARVLEARAADLAIRYKKMQDTMENLRKKLPAKYHKHLGSMEKAADGGDPAAETGTTAQPTGTSTLVLKKYLTPLPSGTTKGHDDISQHDEEASGTVLEGTMGGQEVKDADTFSTRRLRAFAFALIPTSSVCRFLGLSPPLGLRRQPRHEGLLSLRFLHHQLRPTRGAATIFRHKSDADDDDDDNRLANKNRRHRRHDASATGKH
ncbi:hypothetical protein SODALDRAFT_356751 [Sodiomyces alkalinus F11]|uniref:Uncharacterized protein n=1 Tax=Sodiomyces alkalinus (strain CBS 110278 / VKM F-3762 / F11) TaxID=1314773 RepID=A0A3N2Q1V0_SODAK|nr:hypothetical protein SODALDRAFT_356751 [Sodiomyces alkalinus F11]ROT40741.1 hypothetical protein SODALDRAFT_356751 [Sodiomyces alkalinus F11]